MLIVLASEYNLRRGAEITHAEVRNGKKVREASRKSTWNSLKMPGKTVERAAKKSCLACVNNLLPGRLCQVCRAGLSGRNVKVCALNTGQSMSERGLPRPTTHHGKELPFVGKRHLFLFGDFRRVVTSQGSTKRFRVSGQVAQFSEKSFRKPMRSSKGPQPKFAPHIQNAGPESCCIFCAPAFVAMHHED